jgi:hypothetical protein
MNSPNLIESYGATPSASIIIIILNLYFYFFSDRTKMVSKRNISAITIN